MDNSINVPEIKRDLQKYESRYHTIIGRTSMLYERKTQIVFNICISCFVLWMVYISPYAPYSYILGLIAITGQWFTFTVYEKLRVKLKLQISEQNALDYFRQKSDILSDALFIRKLAIINGVLIFVCIWAQRSRERLFDSGVLAMLTFIVLIIVVLVIHYRIKIIPVVNYLRELIIQLETESITRAN